MFSPTQPREGGADKGGMKPGFRHRADLGDILPDDAALAWHVTMRLKHDRVLVPSVGRRRVVVQVIYKQGEGRELLAFGIADTHVHALIAGSRAAAGRFANYVETALRWRLDLPVSFDAARFTPVFDQAHLKNATRYVVAQQARHTPTDDMLLEGSSLFDWLGMRVLGGQTRARMKSLLPRVTSSELLGWLGGVVDASAWGNAAPIHPELWQGLDGVTASAAGVATLESPSDRAAIARRAALHVGQAQFAPPTLREVLKLTSRKYQRLMQRSPELALCKAIETQLRVRSNLKLRAEAAAMATSLSSPTPALAGGRGEHPTSSL